MFSKLFSSSSSSGEVMAETTPMLPSRNNNNSTASRILQRTALDSENANVNHMTHAGKEVVQETVQTLRRLNDSAPYSFRVLGLAGGLAMILSNSFLMMGRLLTLRWSAAMISVWCILFGALIVLLEVNTTAAATTSVQEGIRFYAKFLEFTWGRGLLYVFVGSLQIANWNVLDWIVGGFMMCVGATACAAGVKTAHDLRRFRMTIQNERDLKAKFKKYATTGNNGTGNGGYFLTVQSLSAFIKDSGIVMSQNEVVSAYMALNKGFDDQLCYEEMVDWWGRPSRGDLGFEKISV